MPEGTSSNRKVLVVDDNEDAAMMLSMALEMMGFETVVAHDATARSRRPSASVPTSR